METITDRELLELAAKAAGLVNFRDAGWNELYVKPESESAHSGYYWSPLNNDGDALRLAVKLNIAMAVDARIDKEVSISRPKGGWLVEPIVDDPYAATRRAIVRAAAEIGRSL